MTETQHGKEMKSRHFSAEKCITIYCLCICVTTCARVCASLRLCCEKWAKRNAIAVALARARRRKESVDATRVANGVEIARGGFLALRRPPRRFENRPQTMQERKGDNQSERNSRGEVRATSGKEGKSPNSARSKFLNCQQETKEKKRLEAMGLTKEYLVSEETTICTRKKLLFFLGN